MCQHRLSTLMSKNDSSLVGKPDAIVIEHLHKRLCSHEGGLETDMLGAPRNSTLGRVASCTVFDGLAFMVQRCQDCTW